MFALYFHKMQLSGKVIYTMRISFYQTTCRDNNIYLFINLSVSIFLLSLSINRSVCVYYLFTMLLSLVLTSHTYTLKWLTNRYHLLSLLNFSLHIYIYIYDKCWKVHSLIKTPFSQKSVFSDLIRFCVLNRGVHFSEPCIHLVFLVLPHCSIKTYITTQTHITIFFYVSFSVTL